MNKLSDQVKVLQTSPPILASVSSAPTLDSNNCWLSSAEKLGLKKTATSVPKPSQLEVKITNSILSEQADRDRRKKNLVIFGIPSHSSTAIDENAKKKEESDEDRKKLEKVFQAIDVDIAKVKAIHRFKVRQASTRPAPILVELTEESDRNIFLRSAKKLKTMEHFREVYINADLTEKERI